MRIPLKTKLAKLEDRLQSLIEGGAARFFPAQNTKNDLAPRLISAMKDNLYQDEHGNLLAPNLFTLLVPPHQAQALREDKTLLEELECVLEQAGQAAGLSFPSPPSIKIMDATGDHIEGVRILAQINLKRLGDTSSLEPETGQPGELPPGAFLIINGSQIFPLDRPVINIGRRADNHLIFDDPRVSRAHAQLRCIKGRFVIFDLDSAGGTYVNRQRVTRCALYPGDVVSLAGISGLSLIFGQDGLTAGSGTQKVPADQD